MNTPSNEITIIIILYEEKEKLVLRCLENLKNFKIIIVDNANNINLKRIVEKNYKIYKYILNKKKLRVLKSSKSGDKTLGHRIYFNVSSRWYN